MLHIQLTTISYDQWYIEIIGNRFEAEQALKAKYMQVREENLRRYAEHQSKQSIMLAKIQLVHLDFRFEISDIISLI